MSDLVYVSPQRYLVSNENWKSEVQKTGYIAILKADLPKFRDSLQKLKHVNANDKKDTTQSHTSDSGLLEGQEKEYSSSNKDNNNVTTRYQPLKHFLPISLEQQLHTISIKGLPYDESFVSMDTFLDKIMDFVRSRKLLNSKCDVESWTRIHSTGLDTQNIFIRFKKNQREENSFSNLVMLLKELETRSKLFQIGCDLNTLNFIKDNATIDDFPKLISEEIITEFNDIILGTFQSKSFAKKDTLQDIALDYHIDLDTLSDLPRDSLDQLCKDIIEFRTKVVKIEKQKLIDDSMKENKRRREHMMKIFDTIRKSQGQDNQEVNEKEEEERNETQDNNENDSFDVEKGISQRELDESDKRYKNLLSDLMTTINPRIQSLRLNIEKAATYEEDLKKNRAIELKELEHLANDPYYNKHRPFKDEESRLDDINREKFGSIKLEKKSDMTVDITVAHNTQEEKYNEATINDNTSEMADITEPEQINIKFEFKKAIDRSAENGNDVSDMEGDITVDREIDNDNSQGVETVVNSMQNILPFTEDDIKVRLGKLKDSRLVDELIKEYLGVYEDELVEYIFENIEENKSKTVLLDDLKETFDEDAIIIVDRIWNCKEFK